jgi:single-strand DNA-binding protein
MINQAVIEGRLGKDPEVKSFGSTSLVKFSIAHREAWKDKQSGEWKEKISWFNVESRNNVDKLSNQLRKGDLVVCAGKVVVESWTNPDTNQKSNFVKFVANSINKLEAANRDSSNGYTNNNANSNDGESDDLPF